MSVGSSINKFIWYYRKHGFVQLVKRAWEKGYGAFNSKEFLFYLDLETELREEKEINDRIHMEIFRRLEEVHEEDLHQLKEIKSSEGITAFLDSFFNRGADLWLVKEGNTVVGLVWTLVGGFEGFYSIPLTEKDAISLAAEIFPEFRGRKIWPTVKYLQGKALSEMGIKRIYSKVHVRNESMLRSVSKTNQVCLGAVRTFRVAGKYITIWDRKTVTSKNAGTIS